MNNLTITLLAMLTISLLFSSCSSDDDNNDTVQITVDDAAELVAVSVAATTYSAVYNMDYVSEQIVELLDCADSESETRTDTETSNNGEFPVSLPISYLLLMASRFK